MGYETCITGKWHLGSKPEWGPRQFGFDHSHGALAGGVDQYGHFYKDGPYRQTWHRNDQFIDEEGHATDLFARQAIRWIKTERNGPFFVYVAFTAVHIPLQEPRQWLRVYDNKIDDPSRRLFAACATHMDDAIGKIVAAVEESGQRENTLILFTSDNGRSGPWSRTSQYGGGHLPCPVLGSNKPLRGRKGQVYEGGIRVPAFVNWPKKLQATTVDSPIHIVDWFATLSHVAGYEPKDSLNWDGKNVWPLITGEEVKSAARAMYWKGPRGTAIRYGDWKLVVRNNEQRELFNLAADPNEKRNLIENHPQRVDELTELMINAQQADLKTD